MKYEIYLPQQHKVNASVSFSFSLIVFTYVYAWCNGTTFFFVFQVKKIIKINKKNVSWCILGAYFSKRKVYVSLNKNHVKNEIFLSHWNKMCTIKLTEDRKFLLIEFLANIHYISGVFAYTGSKVLCVLQCRTYLTKNDFHFLYIIHART